MMGHRGCRLAVTFPEIAKMQTRAVIKAAIAVSKRKNIKIVPTCSYVVTMFKREKSFADVIA